MRDPEAKREREREWLGYAVPRVVARSPLLVARLFVPHVGCGCCAVVSCGGEARLGTVWSGRAARRLCGKGSTGDDDGVVDRSEGPGARVPETPRRGCSCFLALDTPRGAWARACPVWWGREVWAWLVACAVAGYRGGLPALPFFFLKLLPCLWKPGPGWV